MPLVSTAVSAKSIYHAHIDTLFILYNESTTHGKHGNPFSRKKTSEIPGGVDTSTWIHCYIVLKDNHSSTVSSVKTISAWCVVVLIMLHTMFNKMAMWSTLKMHQEAKRCSLLSDSLAYLCHQKSCRPVAMCTFIAQHGMDVCKDVPKSAKLQHSFTEIESWRLAALILSESRHTLYLD